MAESNLSQEAQFQRLGEFCVLGDLEERPNYVALAVPAIAELLEHLHGLLGVTVPAQAHDVPHDCGMGLVADLEYVSLVDVSEARDCNERTDDNGGFSLSNVDVTLS